MTETWYDRHVLPWLIDWACGAPMFTRQRALIIPWAHGRVLKPGGKLLFSEHWRSPDAAVTRWQTRLQPYWKPLAGGCHLDRDMPALLAQAGFVSNVQRRHLWGPRVVSCHYWGEAVAA